MKIVDGAEAAFRPRGMPAYYPWDEWLVLDGEIRFLERYKDYHGSSKNMAQQVRKNTLARKHLVRIRFTDEGVYYQVYEDR